LVQCSNNLRAIGQAVSLYANLNRGVLLGDSDSYGNRWPFALMPPTGTAAPEGSTDPILTVGDAAIFQCPAQQLVDTSSQPWEFGGGYALNHDLETWGPSGSFANKALHTLVNGHFYGGKIVDVVNPAEYALAWDSNTPLTSSAAFGWHFDGSDYLGPQAPLSPANTNAGESAETITREPDPTRHYGGRGNVLFLDGHVNSYLDAEIQASWVRYDDINAMRWNISGTSQSGL